MNDGQALLERCLLLPSDQTARKVFADWLQEHDEPELAEAMRGEKGQHYLTDLQWESNRIARFPCVKFLWAVVFVTSVSPAEAQVQADLLAAIQGGSVNMLSAGQLLTLPAGFEVLPAGPPPANPVPFAAALRPWWFRRLLGG